MKTVNYVPSVCHGESPTFEGGVLIRVPTFDEKYEYLEALDVHVGDDGTVETKARASNLKRLRQMVSLSKAHYVSMDLVKKATGEQFTSFDDLTCDEDGHVILMEIATKILHGFKVGNG